MNILFTGAHPDDIEHGAGGIFCRLLRQKKHKVKYLSFSYCTDLERNRKIKDDINNIQHHLEELGCEFLMLDFPNRKFPKDAFEIREVLEHEKVFFNPSIVFTHWEGDIHQDHQVVANECYRVFRNQTILGYECLRSCPKFAPSVFLLIDQIDLDSKIDLLSLYKTQALYYNSEQALRGLATVRGIEVGRDLAEGFSLVRMVSGGSECVSLL
jgi:LmbE family N-acetylglucosaminyl deacetylase